MRTKIFFDTEFTGLHADSTLISIGMVSETGGTFYAEFTDYDQDQVNPWIQENVISKLHLTGNEKGDDLHNLQILGTTEQIRDAICVWLEQFGEVEMWSDCLAYDWVLFCGLWDNALSVPSYIYYIPFDICTLFRVYEINPDINREEYAYGSTNVVKNKHNAYWDALVIKACHDELVTLM